VLIWRALGQAARRDDAFAGGVRLAFLGIFIAGMYHQVFLSFPVAWMLWAAVGLVLRPRDEPGAEGTPVARGSIGQIDATPARQAS
jgi:hypothetical protein